MNLSFEKFECLPPEGRDEYCFVFENWKPSVGVGVLLFGTVVLVLLQIILMMSAAWLLATAELKGVVELVVPDVVGLAKAVFFISDVLIWFYLAVGVATSIELVKINLKWGRFKKKYSHYWRDVK